MLKLVISGCNGAMGHIVGRIASADPDVEVVAGFDVNATKTDSFPVYADPMEFGGQADVAGIGGRWKEITTGELHGFMRIPRNLS